MSRPYSSYGQALAPTMSSGTVFLPGKRLRLNIVAIGVNILAPWVVFCAVFAAMSFNLRIARPMVAFSVVGLAFMLTFGAGYLAYRTKTKERDATWYGFCAIALLVASLGGVMFGDMNFRANLAPFAELSTLNSYPSVNPAHERGQQLMDAGRVYFTEGTGLDISKSMSFKNLDLYCVVPITKGADQLASYDFWAVGVNCCDGVSSEFKCGEFNNPHARAGIRLMRDDQRPFFRLAVQQAEAAYGIQAKHPLFFTWMQDPQGELNNLRREGMKLFMLGTITHFFFNLFCVVCAVLGFSKIGHY